jgi:hypothetical protein
MRFLIVVNKRIFYTAGFQFFKLFIQNSLASQALPDFKGFDQYYEHTYILFKMELSQNKFILDDLFQWVEVPWKDDLYNLACC